MVRSSSENNTYKFNFDRVFDPTSHQKEVYDFSAKHIVESVLEGFNGTIFAYGQTSSGKTHTMQGIIDNPEKEGIIPRMIRHLFNFIVNSSSDTEYIVKVSMIEIYMEKIKDLINPDRTNLNVREDKAKGIYIEDLSEHYVVSEEEVLEIMKLGSDNRSVAATNMNEHSSRSHSIFIMTIHQNNVKDMSARTGKLYLVDLAGSEKISKTGATGLTLEEAKTINKSLTTLGMVINSLTDGKSTHIPYRESKLTRVLQESLGGNAKTCLIITCSPSIYNESETLSTLRFGLRAKKIKNKPKINKETTVAELKIEIDKMDKTIQKLIRRIKQLENFIIKNGLSIPAEDEIDFERESEIENIEGETKELNNELEENENKDKNYENVKSFEDPKISFGNIPSNNQEILAIEQISRLTGVFGNKISNNENEKIFANGNLEQIIRQNADYSNKIKEFEEENKTLNEQIEFLHEFISRLDKELESKSNAIINLEITNKKQSEEIDHLKAFHNENINNDNKEENNYLFSQKKLGENLIEKENESTKKFEAAEKDIIINSNEFHPFQKAKSDNIIDSEVNCEIDVIREKIEEKKENIISELDRQSITQKALNDLEEEKLQVNITNNGNKNNDNIEVNRVERASNLFSRNKIKDFMKSDEFNNDNELNIYDSNDRNSFVFKSGSKRKIEEGEESQNLQNSETNQQKSADKEDNYKKDLTLLEIFQQLKKERKITKSTNFNQLENLLANTFPNHEMIKKTIGCQTDFDYDEQQYNNNLNVNNMDTISNHEGIEVDNNELFIEKNFNNVEEEFKHIQDFNEFIGKIESLKEKLQTEKNLIENIFNAQIENRFVGNDKIKIDENNKENCKGDIELREQTTKTENINNLNPQISYIISQLDLLVTEFKEGSKKFNNDLPNFNNRKTLARQTINPTSIKYTQEELDELCKKANAAFEEKLLEDKRKHENEKKTILKVLEEKCEKFNILEIENGDLKSQIKSLEFKMSPDEKANKKIFVKLEQNIEQLNLILEKTAAEKTQLAINMKVFNNFINIKFILNSIIKYIKIKVLEKKFSFRNQEIEKINKENYDLKEQVIIYFSIVFSN